MRQFPVFYGISTVKRALKISHRKTEMVVGLK